jgi:NAD(P)-dependent dehydrogenase (short-subunit alcohol dehydrogenase family)
MSLRDSVAVVTGATSGIGLDAAHRLAALGGTLVLVCRDEQRGVPARDAVRAASSNPDVHLVTADFASLTQVREAGERIAREWPRLDALVNNAGLASLRRTLTEDGFELTLQVDHLSHFLLTNLLLEPLRAGRARVVTVASGAHRHGKLRRMGLEEILRGLGAYRGLQAYSDAKLANVLFTLELARRERGRGITANALHPGTLSTGIWDRNPGWPYWAAKLLKPFMEKPAVGGRAAAWLASDPALEGVTGTYFRQRTPAAAHANAHDEALARELWDVSARAVGIG